MFPYFFYIFIVFSLASCLLTFLGTFIIFLYEIAKMTYIIKKMILAGSDLLVDRSLARGQS